MAVRQYVGARYVPKFYQNSQNPLYPTWEGNKSYEAMTIVSYNNDSYTSKVPVPAGVGNPAENPTYWVCTGNYNAQVEQYRQTAEGTANNLAEEIQNRTNADTELQNNINSLTEEVKNNLYHNIVNAVQLGMDNTGNNPCDSIMENAMQNYDCIFFPSGTYKFNNTVTFTKNFAILGVSPQQTIFQFNNGSHVDYTDDVDDPSVYRIGAKSHCAFLLNTGTSVVFKDFQLKTTGSGIYASGTSAPICENVWVATQKMETVANNLTFAFTTENVPYAKFDGCQHWCEGTVSNSDGIHLCGGNNILIANCQLDGNDDQLAINPKEMQTVNNVFVTNCIIKGYGLRVYADSTHSATDIRITNTLFSSTSDLWCAGLISQTVNPTVATNLSTAPTVEMFFSNCGFYSTNYSGDLIGIRVHGIRGYIYFSNCNSSGIIIDNSPVNFEGDISSTSVQVTDTSLPYFISIEDRAYNATFTVTTNNQHIGNFFKVTGRYGTLKATDVEGTYTTIVMKEFETLRVEGTPYTQLECTNCLNLRGNFELGLFTEVGAYTIIGDDDTQPPKRFRGLYKITPTEPAAHDYWISSENQLVYHT